MLKSVLSVIFPDSWSSQNDVEASVGSGSDADTGLLDETGVGEGVSVVDAERISGQNSLIVESVFDEEAVVVADDAPNKVVFAHFVFLIKL